MAEHRRGLGRGLSALLGEADASPATPTKDADTRALEDDLSEALGLGVEITHHDGAGELRVRYTSLEQLDDLCRRLTRGG